MRFAKCPPPSRRAHDGSVPAVQPRQAETGCSPPGVDRRAVLDAAVTGAEIAVPESPPGRLDAPGELAALQRVDIGRRDDVHGAARLPRALAGQGHPGVLAPIGGERQRFRGRLPCRAVAVVTTASYGAPAGRTWGPHVQCSKDRAAALRRRGILTG